MEKFIITATVADDIVKVTMDAQHYFDKVSYDGNPTLSDYDAICDSYEQLDGYWENESFNDMDDAIMSGDVPVGSMVVAYDGTALPKYGYVCGNGIMWHRVVLNDKQKKAIANYRRNHYSK